MSSKAAKREIMRRLRLGDLRKLLRARCGHTLPDNDAGREYLWELLLPTSLAPEESGRKMANTIKVWAPWMDIREAEQFPDQINRMPPRERMPKRRAFSASGCGSPTKTANGCGRGLLLRWT
jgi:hypothetical protein